MDYDKLIDWFVFGFTVYGYVLFGICVLIQIARYFI